MSAKLLWTFVCVSLCILSSEVHRASAIISCCADDQVLIRESDDSIPYCWDEDAVAVSNLTLSKQCNNIYVVVQGDIFNYTIKNEQLELWRDKRLLQTVSTVNFCNGSALSSINESHPKPVVGVCFEYPDDSRNFILACCMMVSIVFLCITAIVYICLPELRDLQGKSIINLCVSFAASLTCIVIIELVPYEDMAWCAFKGFCAYFFMMASFFWMNSISIQVLRSIRNKSPSSYDWKEFCYYAAYSWGCAVILTISAIAANYIPGDHVYPGFGYERCWFFGHTEQWAFMYSVLTVLIVANTCIFIYTSFMLWRHSFKSTSIKVLRYKFCLCLRLFVVMGIAWIFEIAGSAHGEYSIFWMIADVFNTLQGLLIFIILVVLRKRTIKVMYAHGWLCCLSERVQKYLARVDDEEQNEVQHTAVMSFDDKS